MKKKFILNVSYADFINIKIVCKNDKQRQHLKEVLKANSYNFFYEKKEISYNYIIKFRNKRGLNNKKFKSEILLHNQSRYNDSDPIVFGKYYDENGSRFIYDPRFDAVIQYDKSNKIIVIYSGKKKADNVVLDLLREQFIQKNIENNKFYYMKCAAFAYNKENICCFTGDSKSGKTTMLLNYMSKNTEAKFLTNSASYIINDCINIKIFSWRPHMRIRFGTAVYLSQKNERLKEYIKEKQTINSNDDFLKLDTYDKISQVFNFNTIKDGSLSKIIFLCPQKNEKLYEICRIKDKDRAYSILEKIIRNENDPAHPDCWEIGTVNLEEKPKSIIFDEIVNKCDIYEFKYDYNRIEEVSENVAKILESILY